MPHITHHTKQPEKCLRLLSERGPSCLIYVCVLVSVLMCTNGWGPCSEDRAAEGKPPYGRPSPNTEPSGPTPRSTTTGHDDVTHAQRTLSEARAGGRVLQMTRRSEGPVCLGGLARARLTATKSQNALQGLNVVTCRHVTQCCHTKCMLSEVRKASPIECMRSHSDACFGCKATVWAALSSD